jgi:UDP-N-acetyl-D-galactosamine dehydrogenase
MPEKIAVIGLGYVGLPLLMAFARHEERVVGFDIDQHRVEALCAGNDWTGEVDREILSKTTAKFTHRAEDLYDRTLYIVTVPTPIDRARRPNLSPLMAACKTIGEILRVRQSGSRVPLIVFESTVYPGLTEDVCGVRIAEHSGLTQHKDFKLGYSPERINPGDKKNTLKNIVKIISAEDSESLDRLAEVYGKVVEARLHCAPSIRVAEAAKVLENTQRDLNVALMNELAIICDRLGIRTHDVLVAAGTKWNFLKFTPGLVGGHCIGVDPHYLTYRAEELGYNPQVILAGRRINDTMAIFVAQKIVKLLVNGAALRPGVRVGILGVTFKENVRDLRNSRVPEIVAELEAFGVDVLVHDPLADPTQAQREYRLPLCAREDLADLDALVLAVPHHCMMDTLTSLWSAILPNGWLIDVKSVIDPAGVPSTIRYWSL